MYYPYLRAQQNELIAVRDLSSEDNFKNNVTPVLEPINANLNGLKLANTIFNENKFNPFLIVNPLAGEICGNIPFFLDFIQGLEACSYKIAFHYTDNAEYILDCIRKYALNDVMLICLQRYQDTQCLRDLCENPAISHVMVLKPEDNIHLDSYLKNLNKTYIRLDDLFEKKDANVLYLSISAHKFSSKHLTFMNEGYDGFSDFTVLPSVYKKGGGSPTAVVIHFSYLNENENNEVWISHFTSSTNVPRINVQGKFAEAAEKAINFIDEQVLHNAAIAELQNYFLERHYPGLGVVKKISIKNHLIIMSDFLELNAMLF